MHHFWKCDFSCAVLLSVAVPVRKRTLSSSVAWTLFDNDKNSTVYQPRNIRKGWNPALCRASCRFAWHLARPKQAWLRRKKRHLGCSSGVKPHQLRRFIHPLSCCKAKGRECRQPEPPQQCHQLPCTAGCASAHKGLVLGKCAKEWF